MKYECKYTLEDTGKTYIELNLKSPDMYLEQRFKEILKDDSLKVKNGILIFEEKE